MAEKPIAAAKPLFWSTRRKVAALIAMVVAVEVLNIWPNPTTPLLDFCSTLVLVGSFVRIIRSPDRMR